MDGSVLGRTESAQRMTVAVRLPVMMLGAAMLASALGCSHHAAYQPPLAVARCLAFSPDGKQLVAGVGKDLVFWDVASGQKLNSVVAHKGNIVCLAWSKDGKYLASGGQDNAFKVWDAAKRQLLHEFTGHKPQMTSAAFSPDGTVLATTAGNPNPYGIVAEVKLWDLHTGQFICDLKGHTSEVTDCAFTPDGKALLTCGREKQILFWDWKKHKPLGRKISGQGPMFRHMALSGDGKTIAVTNDENSVLLYDAATGKQKGHIPGNDPPVNSVVALSPDGSLVASVANNFHVFLWDVATGKQLADLQRHTRAVEGLAFGGEPLLLATGADTVYLWDTRSKQTRATLR